jgi:hypothetical protein
MSSPSVESRTLTALRRFLLALLSVGLAATGTDLILLEHYEDAWQFVPLVLIAVAIGLVAWNAIAARAASVRILQGLMISMVLSGAIGVGLHYQGNLEFQLEMDPSRSRWELFKEVIHAKAPPAMAPAAMAHLGLLGLAFTFRHPAVARPSRPETGARS